MSSYAFSFSIARASLPQPASGLKRLSRPAPGTSNSHRRGGLQPIHCVVECGWSSLVHGLRADGVVRFRRRSDGHHPAVRENARSVTASLRTISSAGPSLAKAGQLPARYVAFCEQLLAPRCGRHGLNVMELHHRNPPIRQGCGSVARFSKQDSSNRRSRNSRRTPGSTASQGLWHFAPSIGKDGLIRTLELVEGHRLVRIRARRRHPLVTHRLC